MMVMALAAAAALAADASLSSAAALAAATTVVAGGIRCQGNNNCKKYPLTVIFFTFFRC